VAGQIEPRAVLNTLLAWGRFCKSGIQLTSILGVSSWRAVLTQAQEVYPQMTVQDGRMMYWAVNIITAATTEEGTTSEADVTSPHSFVERAFAAFWADAER